MQRFHRAVREITVKQRSGSNCRWNTLIKSKKANKAKNKTGMRLVYRNRVTYRRHVFPECKLQRPAHMHTMQPDRVAGVSGISSLWWRGTAGSVMSGRCVELGQVSPGRPEVANSGGERDHRRARTHDKRKRSNRNLVFDLFHVSNRHEQVLWKTSMTYETCLVFMLYINYGFTNNTHILHKASIFAHAHVD